MNSTIIRKKKQLKCGCFDYAFSKNRCRLHATVEDTKKRAEKYAAQPTVRKAGWFNVELTETEDKVVAEISNEPKKGNGELWRWFQSQRSKMKGVCSHCVSKTQKNDDKTFHYSICHILPKNLFKSVATNDDNWIELCYYNNSCHSNFDNNMIDIIDLNCFDEVVEKVTRMYPHIAPEERRRIPAILREYIKLEL